MRALREVLAVALFVCSCSKARPLQGDLAEPVSWEEDIAQLFAARCSSCHSGATASAGYRTTSYLEALGPQAAPVAAAGDESSLLLRTIDPARADAVHAQASKRLRGGARLGRRGAAVPSSVPAEIDGPGHIDHPRPATVTFSSLALPDGANPCRGRRLPAAHAGLDARGLAGMVDVAPQGPGPVLAQRARLAPKEGISRKVRMRSRSVCAGCVLVSSEGPENFARHPSCIVVPS
jgi:hypothetical protein